MAEDLPTEVQLTREELLEVQLLNIQRDNVQLRASQELDRIEKDMQRLSSTINSRLGIDIAKYRVDFQTGLAKLIET